MTFVGLEGGVGHIVGAQQSFGTWTNPGILYKCTKYHRKEQTVSKGPQKYHFAIMHFFWDTLYEPHSLV